MTRRSRAREVALQLLFQRDVNPDVPRPVIERFARDRLGNPEAEAFCLGLYDGVVRHLTDIDARLTAASENWKLHRMAASDRNVLRLGTYEIVYSPDADARPGRPGRGDRAGPPVRVEGLAGRSSTACSTRCFGVHLRRSQKQSQRSGASGLRLTAGLRTRR